MASAQLSTKEAARIGRRIYDREIREKVETKHRGKFLFVDIDTGDYEFDADQVAAGERLRERHPDSLLYMVRIGYPTAVKFGPRLKLKRR
jgi:hypothetical protein